MGSTENTHYWPFILFIFLYKSTKQIYSLVVTAFCSFLQVLSALPVCIKNRGITIIMIHYVVRLLVCSTFYTRLKGKVKCTIWNDESSFKTLFTWDSRLNALFSGHTKKQKTMKDEEWGKNETRRNAKRTKTHVKKERCVRRLSIAY